MILTVCVRDFDMKYLDDIKECIIHNSSNRYFDRIIVFCDKDLGLSYGSKKISTMKMDATHFEAISYSLKQARRYVVYSNPLVKFIDMGRTIEAVDRDGIIARCSDSYYIFGKNTKIRNRSCIDDILVGKFIEASTHSEKKGYYSIPGFPVASAGWKISKRIDMSEAAAEAEEVRQRAVGRSEHQAPADIAKIESKVRKLDVVIVSVDYNDVLDITLERNSKIFESIVVVTSNSDSECDRICRKHGVKVVKTDCMYYGGASFNKGKAINVGMASIENPDVVLLLDADVIVEDMPDLSSINENIIYYRDRIMLRDYDAFERYESGERSLETQSIGPVGYFQMFSYKGQKYPESSHDAAWSDVKFARRFRHKMRIETPVLHLGEDGKNWKGRITESFEKKSEIEIQAEVSIQEDIREFEINSYFDNIYCINLDNRKDRWKKAAKNMEIAGIYAERVSGIEGASLDFVPKIESEEASSMVGNIENSAALGCLLTHLKVVKDAKSKGYKKILILEDDVLFSKDFAKDAVAAAKKDWKMLYLGASQFDWSGISPQDGFYRCKNTLGTFAYALDCSIYDNVIKEFERMDRSADNALASVQKRIEGCYVFFPNIAISDVSDSDIRKEKDMLEYSDRMNWDLSRFNQPVDVFRGLVKKGHVEICRVSDYQTNGKNILFLINLNDTGGAEYVSYQHVKALRELGYGVSVISAGKGMFFEKTLELGVTVYHSRLDKMDHSIVNDVLSEITKNVDVVYNCNYFGISDHIYGIKNKSRFEYFTIAHSNIEWVVDEVYRHDSITDRYIVIHDKIRDCLNMKGVCNSRIYTIPNYVDFSCINVLHSKSDRNVIREKLGFSKDDFVIGMTTRISPDKNILDSLRILQNLDKRVKLLIIGDAPNKREAIPYKEELLKEIEERNLSERVFITGHVDNDGVFEYLSCVDISMNTSPSEGLPISMLEQMSCGIHCVYPPHGEIAAVLEGLGSIIGIRQRKSFDAKSKDYIFNRFDDFEIDMYVDEIKRIMDEGTIDGNLISDRIRYDRSVEAVRPYLDFAFGGPKEGVSFVIRARDEISNIESCIRSISDIADEIVYVDHLSKDGTYEKAIELSRIYSNLRVFRYDREIPKAGTNYRKNIEKIGNSIAQYYNFCLTKATRTCILKWDADFVANKKNLSEMISVENLKNRRDKFSLWFTGETVFVCGEKKYINEKSYYDEFRGFSLLNGVKWTDAYKCEYIDRDYANSSISSRFEKPCFYEIKRLDIKEFEHRDGLIDIRDKNDFDIIASLGKGSVPEMLREIEFLNESVVITYGTFDTFHYGHLEILRKAKELGQFLIVGISTDRFNAIKGKKSVFSFEQRKRWVESIKHVDLVIEEDAWDQKYFDVRKYNADIFVMGDDWKGKFDDLPCKVVYLSRTEGISTTEIKKIL